MAAPRYADAGPDLYNDADETDGRRRAIEWLQTMPDTFATASPVAGYAALHAWVAMLGPGSAALGFCAIPEVDPGTGEPIRNAQGQPETARFEPILVVYPARVSRDDPAPAPGPVWWDPVTDDTWDQPPTAPINGSWWFGFIALPPGRRIDPDLEHPIPVADSDDDDDDDSDDIGTDRLYSDGSDSDAEDSGAGESGPGDSDAEESDPANSGAGNSDAEESDAGNPDRGDSDAEQAESQEDESEGSESDESESEQGAAPDNPFDLLPAPPMELADPAAMRVFGPDYLAPIEDDELQETLENALRGPEGFVAYADPSSYPSAGSPYGTMINPGFQDIPGRRTNCQDCMLAGLASFLGYPLVAAPVHPIIVNGNVIWDGESFAADRQDAMTGLGERNFRHGSMSPREQLTAIHDHVAALGPGSAALVSTVWQPMGQTGPESSDSPPVSGDGHGVLVVYPKPDPGNLDENGRVIDNGPLWWDPQSGEMSRRPFETFARHSHTIGFTFIPPGRSVFDASAVGRRPVQAQPVAQPVPSHPQSALVPVLDRPAPMRLPDPSRTRRFGAGALDAAQHPGQQQLIETVLRDSSGNFVVGADPRTYPSPGYPYGWMVNGGQGGVRGRSTNRWEAALSGLSSFLGNPLAAARRSPDMGPGPYDGSEEPRRAVQWLQTRLDDFGSGSSEQQYAALWDRVAHSGPGSAALAFCGVGTVDPGTGEFAVDQNGRFVLSHYEPLVLVFPTVATAGDRTSGPAEPLWWDPMTNSTWEQAPAEIVELTVQLRFIEIRPGTRVDASGRGPVVRPVPVPLVVPVFNRAGPPMRLMDPSRGRVFGPG
ncbi:toxin glutamine deamidase domain-containing protein, partial [Nocardia carnea]